MTFFHFLTGHPPRGMPLGEWASVRSPRWSMWAFGSGVIFVGAVGALQAAELVTTGSTLAFAPSSTMFVLSLGQLASVLCLWIVPRLRERRFERCVRERAYEVCLNCGYSLRGLPEIHRCPECGVEFVKESVRAEWRAWLRR